jgi:hypothetical protein
MALLLTVESLGDPPTAMLKDTARRRLEAGCRSLCRLSTLRVPLLLLTDISLQLPSQFLTKVDRATDRHSGMLVEPRITDSLVRALDEVIGDNECANALHGQHMKLQFVNLMWNRPWIDWFRQSSAP